MMKTLQDYPGYANEEATLNALAAKRTEIEKELQALEAQLAHPLPAGDVVADALSITPGIQADTPDAQTRHKTLREQVTQLGRAIDKQYQRVTQVRRKASQRLFAENAATWQHLAGEMMGVVDQIIAVNKAIRSETTRLERMGCEDVPGMAFPDFGLVERLPYWRDELRAQLMQVNFNIEAITHDEK